jgi:WD40 repeat protein
MTTWPQWHLDHEPAALAKYVLPTAVAHLLTLPGPSDVDPLRRVEQVYEAIRAVGVDYAIEPPGSVPGWQAIRSPREVLVAPRHGSCLDLVLVAAGALYQAGIAGIPVILERSDKRARHAVLLVDLDRVERSGQGSGVLGAPPIGWQDDLTTTLQGPPARYCVLDVSAAARRHGEQPQDFEEALRRGSDYLTSDAWDWQVGIDLDVLWRSENVLNPADAGLVAGTGFDGRWIYRGGRARTHFRRAARGQLAYDDVADNFVGRESVLDAIRSHIRGAKRGKPLVVTGAPGAGKSSAVSRVVESLDDADFQGLAFHCADSTLDDFVSAVSALVGHELAERDVFDALSGYERNAVIVVEALDECRTDDDRERIARMLPQIFLIAHVRVVVSTRDVADTGGRWSSTLIARLHGGRIDPDSLCVVDSADYFRREELVEVAHRTLAHPPAQAKGNAWKAYAADDQLALALASTIAERAGSNYYLAVMVATRLANANSALDSLAQGFDIEILPEDIYQLLDEVMTRLDDTVRERFGTMLAALAYGRGAGLTDARWIDFSGALEIADASSADLELIRRGPLHPFLSRDRVDGAATTSFFHRSLVEVFTEWRDTAADERAISSRLREAWRGDGHARDPYVLQFLPSHALAGGLAEWLVSDADVVSLCEPAAVAPVARHAVVETHSAAGAAYLLAQSDLAVYAESNAQTLYIAARALHEDELAEQLLRRASWGAFDYLGGISRSIRPPLDHFLGHTSRVTAVETLLMPNGETLVVSACVDGRVLVWDPFRPGLSIHGAMATGPGALTITSWGEGAEVWVAFGGDDGKVCVWRPISTGDEEYRKIRVYGAAITAMITIVLPEHGRCIVTGTATGEAIVQRVDDSTEVARFSTGDAAILALESAALSGSGNVVIVAGCANGVVTAWDIERSDPALLWVHHHHTDWVGSVAVMQDVIHGGVVVSAGGDSSTIVVALEGPHASEVIVRWAHKARIRDVRIVEGYSGQRVIMTSSDDGTVVLSALTAHGVKQLTYFDGAAAEVNCTAYVATNDRSIFVSGCRDGRILLWNPDMWDLADEETAPPGQHSGRVRCSEMIEVDSPRRSLLMTGANDGSVRLWNRTDAGYEDAGEFLGHHDWVRDMCTIDWPGLPHKIVLSASGDGTIQAWDALSPGTALSVYRRHSGFVRSIRLVRSTDSPFPLALSASQDGTAKIWNPYSISEEHVAELRHPDIVRCAVQVDGLQDTRILTTSGGALRVWDWGNAVPHATTLLEVDEDLRDIAVYRDSAGTMHVAVVGNDDLVHSVSLADGNARSVTGAGHRGWVWGLCAVATSDGGDILITTSSDGTARVWEQRSDQLVEVSRINLLAAGLSVRAFGDEVVITTSRGFQTFRLVGEPSQPIVTVQ